MNLVFSNQNSLSNYQILLDKTLEHSPNDFQN